VRQDMLGDVGRSREPVEVKIFGSDIEDLNRVADEVGTKIQQVPGIVDYKGPQRGNPELTVTIDPALAAHVGLSVAQVSDQLQAGLLGESTTDFRRSDRLIPIRVRYTDKFRGQENNIRQFPIMTANKQVVPLESLATIDRVRGQNELLRENQRLMVVLTARLENRDLGSAISDIRRVLADYKFPVGYTYEIGGQYESQQSSFRQLLFVL